MVKDNKYSPDKIRVEMTDGKRYFSLLSAVCVFYQNPPSLKGRLKSVEWLNSSSGWGGGGRKKKFSSFSLRALS